MKALADEQLSPRLALALRRRGHDVLAVSGNNELSSRSDAEILDWAHQHRRAVITNNVKDFRPLAAERIADGRAHSGLILMPASRSRTRHDLAGLVEAIECILLKNPSGLSDSERWI